MHSFLCIFIESLVTITLHPYNLFKQLNLIDANIFLTNLCGALSLIGLDGHLKGQIAKNNKNLIKIYLRDFYFH